MNRSTWRHVAEHEAAHAVVAAHLGVRVREILLHSPTYGHTVHDATTDPERDAAITAAGDVYNRKLSSLPYADLSCSDLADFERTHGLTRLWQAERLALGILTQRRAAVTALAERIERERTITFTH